MREMRSALEQLSASFFSLSKWCRIPTKSFDNGIAAVEIAAKDKVFPPTGLHFLHMVHTFFFLSLLIAMGKVRVSISFLSKMIKVHGLGSPNLKIFGPASNERQHLCLLQAPGSFHHDPHCANGWKDSVT